MMPYAACLAHAGCGYYYVAALEVVYLHALLHRLSDVQAVKLEKVAASGQRLSLVIVAVRAAARVYARGLYAERAVNIYRHLLKAGYCTIHEKALDIVQKLLCAAHGKCRYDYIAATGYTFPQYLRKFLLLFVVGADCVQPVAIGALQHEVVRALRAFGIFYYGPVVAAYVAREYYAGLFATLSHPYLYGGGAQQMSNVCKPCLHAGAYLYDAVIPYALKEPEGVFGVLSGIERLYKGLACPLIFAVLVFSVLLLYVGAVRQHYPAELCCGLGREYRAIEAALYQQRHHAGMVYMRVGYEQRLYIRRYKGKIPLAVIGMRVFALPHSAVHKYASTLEGYHVA